MNIKPRLIELLSFTYSQEQAFAASLNEAERNARGAPERWSKNDHLAHCAAWQKNLADNLAVAGTGGPYQRFDDIDQRNEQIFIEHQADTLEEILDNLAEAYQTLVAQTSSLSEKELTSTEVLPWQRGRPLWRIIAGNGTLHPISHLAACYHQTGQGKKGLAIYEDAQPILAELSDEPAWQGMLVYDLACFCALAGEKQRAIDALKEALQLAPEFTEWSKQDNDLDSLREETEFKALYSN